MTPPRLFWATALLLIAGGPLLAVAALALASLFDAAAWQALWQDPHWLHALALTLWTGLASTALAWWLAAALLAQGFVSLAGVPCDVVVGEGIEALEGTPPGRSVVLLKFPDNDAALRWYRSEAYQKAIPMRHAAADTADLAGDGETGAELVEQPAVHQEVGLGRVAEDIEA